MKEYIRLSYSMTIITIISIGLLPGGCVEAPKPPETILDSPEHHVVNGYKLLEKGMSNDAKREFQLALQYDPKISSAHRGMGFVYGIKGSFDPAFQSMEKAVAQAENKRNKALAYVGLIRLHTKKRGEGWLTQSEKYFSQALAEVKDLPEAYYYMGVAYTESHLFVQAENSFRKVLEINKSFVMEAEEQLRKVQNNLRRVPDSENEKRIAMDIRQVG